ncbi:MAG: hypothetical protein QXS20_08945 [Candidatus Thorarchaeota archaeon]
MTLPRGDRMQTAIVNRRLQRSEVDLWRSVPGDRPDFPKNDTAWAIEDAFLESDDSIAYLASLNDRPIGATAIHRYRMGQSVGLVVARVTPEFRQRLVGTVIRSSLPFFRSSSIREIDALVACEGDECMEFPHGFEIAPFALETMTKMGFSRRGEMYSCTIDRVKIPQEMSAERLESVEITPDSAREIVLRNRDKTDLHGAVNDSALSIAARLGRLRAIRCGDGSTVVIGLYVYGDTARIDVMDTDDHRLEGTALGEILVSMLRGTDIGRIMMPVIYERQIPTAEAVASATGGSISLRPLSVMKKEI